MRPTRHASPQAGDRARLGYTPRMPLKVLCVLGSARPEPKLTAMMDVAADAAATSGAELRRLDLSAAQLPVMVYGSPEQDALPSVAQVRETAAWADAYLLGTPEYHGSMSGALKNWFDFLYGELAGKLAGVMATTGGGTGDMSITAVKTSLSWCHGFPLPFHAAAREADFEGGRLCSTKVEDRLARMGHDLVRYGTPIRAAFLEAQGREGASSGFAGLH